ncbi:MAG: metallophosphoesterase [Polyangiaceae bacterium]
MQSVQANEAELRIEVDSPTPAILEILPAAADGAKGMPLAHAESPDGPFHSLHVAGLKPSTTYRYRATAGGETREGSLTTAPPDDTKAPISFLIYGDNRTNDDAHASVVHAMLDAPGEFLINSGDLVGNGGDPRRWQRFFDIEQPLIGSRCLYSAIGNHELHESTGANFLKYFGDDDPTLIGLRRLYRTVRWGNIRFFFLNGLDDFTSSDERKWLDAELAKGDAEADLQWRIIVVHHGPWSSSLHGNNLKIRNGGLLEVFRAHKIDLVVSGHDHVYERGDADGLLYLVSGGGGAPLYKVGAPIPSTRSGESTYHFIEARVDGDTFAMTAIRPNGTHIESCFFHKGSSWECPTSSAVSGDSGAAWKPTDDVIFDENRGKPTKRSRCGCTLPGLRAGSANPAALAFLACVALLRRRRRT